MIEPHTDPLAPGEWPVAHNLSKVHKGKVQLINLGTTTITLPNHATLVDLYVIPHHCISEAQPLVEATCDPLQAAMALLNESHKKLLLKQLEITVQEFPLLKQRMLHQLLEKHFFVFVAILEDYR